MRLNCWEVKGCELYPGGLSVDERGPCPASTIVTATGINGGIYAGRACWAVDNTLCAGEKPCDELSKTCLKCNFYLQVKEEEKENFMEFHEIKKELKGYQMF